MKNISDFLGKFKNLEHPDKKKEILIQFFFIETGLLIEKKQIDIRNKTLFLKTDNYVKSEIYLRKEKLLRKIKEQFSELNIKDIR